ncbi:GAF domain-containing protein [Pandoraea sp. ISTKB]|uniref:GAF domain-containing protein n=1 Tax=Pandoraea sp. ISTKB TaxID=1586708 RepID=UPI00084783FF|nr:GAF domain-containing protein [Pandoraea sp. ISTKB]ODP34540.1 hypothetical protein A9762_14145 [Pandoraea sp. ISTKB]
MNRRQFAFASAVSACTLVTRNGYADETAVAARRRLYHEDFAEALLSKIRQAASTTAAFQAWDAIVNPLLPFIHATALVCSASDASNATADRSPGDVRRVFSTVPTAYPVGGWKHLSGSDWAQHVLIEQKTLIASGQAPLKHFFPDYALLESLGVRTLVNIPIVVCRRTIGAFALLFDATEIDRAALAEVERLAPLMAGVFALGQGDAT